MVAKPSVLRRRNLQTAVGIGAAAATLRFEKRTNWRSLLWMIWWIYGESMVNLWWIYGWYMDYMWIIYIYIYTGWWLRKKPSEKYEFVNWDDYSRYMEKVKQIQTTNQRRSLQTGSGDRKHWHYSSKMMIYQWKMVIYRLDIVIYHFFWYYQRVMWVKLCH